MKTITLTITLLVSFLINACGQSDVKVPEPLKVSLAKKFPTAKHVKWGKESKNEWEAEFRINGMEYSANYDINGKWLETESEINKKKLPENIKNTLQKKFGSYKADEAEISETDKGVFYEVKVENKKEELEIVFDKDGKVVSQKSVNEDEEDKD